jgi:hypothetical protein
MAAMAALDWALSGPSAAEQEAAKRKMAELEAERARLQALAEEQARKARIGSAGRMREAWDQQDKERRERLQGVFDVFRHFHSIDPFGDFLFHGVPIYRPEGGPLIVRHLDPDGLAARADEWGKALEGAEERAQELWSKMRSQAPAESAGPIGHTVSADQAGLQNPAGASEPGAGAGGTESAPDNPRPTPGGDTPANPLAQQPGSTQPPGATGAAGQSGIGEGTLRYRTGAFGTKGITGIPGAAPVATPLDAKPMDLRFRASDIPQMSGSVPNAGTIRPPPARPIVKTPIDRVAVPSPTIRGPTGDGEVPAVKDTVSQWVEQYQMWRSDPIHREWEGDALLITTLPYLFHVALATGSKMVLPRAANEVEHVYITDEAFRRQIAVDQEIMEDLWDSLTPRQQKKFLRDAEARVRNVIYHIKFPDGFVKDLPCWTSGRPIFTGTP